MVDSAVMIDSVVRVDFVSMVYCFVMADSASMVNYAIMFFLPPRLFIRGCFCRHG